MEDLGYWYIADMGRMYGPVPWNTTVHWYAQGRISREAQVCKAGSAEWLYLANLLGQRTRRQAEEGALLPTRYEIPIWGGFFIWILGMACMIVWVPLGFLVMFASIALELWGLYMVRTRVERTSVGLLGDVFVVLMIVVQILATVFFVFIALSGFD